LWRLLNFRLFCSDDCRSWPRDKKINNHGCWGKHAHIPDKDYWGICLFHIVWTIFLVQLFLCGTHGIYFYLHPTFCSSTEQCAWAIIPPKEFKSWVCCQIFCDLLLKTAFEWIFNVMQLILFKIKWHIKWKYLIKKFHDICLSYYFKFIFLLSTCRCIPQFSFSCLYFVKNGVGGCLFFLLFFIFYSLFTILFL
jgi:hypothetical protein